MNQQSDPAIRVKTLTIDGLGIGARSNETILDVARENGIHIPTLCYLEGLSSVGACRMCIVEVENTGRLMPACVTRIEEGMVIHTNTPRLQEYRRTILELLFSERNHICAVCVQNGHCELQDLAHEHGMDHLKLPNIYPEAKVDGSHRRFAVDHNRCVLCTRCVRVCDEIEGAHTWDVMGRGIDTRVITDMNSPWGDSETCTSCGKCVALCPTGALTEKGRPPAEMSSGHLFLPYLNTMREVKSHERS